jgi:hypothetical protein
MTKRTKTTTALPPQAFVMPDHDAYWQSEEGQRELEADLRKKLGRPTPFAELPDDDDEPYITGEVDGVAVATAEAMFDAETADIEANLECEDAAIEPTWHGLDERLLLAKVEAIVASGNPARPGVEAALVATYRELHRQKNPPTETAFVVGVNLALHRRTGDRLRTDVRDIAKSVGVRYATLLKIRKIMELELVKAGVRLPEKTGT